MAAPMVIQQVLCFLCVSVSVWLAVSAAAAGSGAAVELLQNPGFESGVSGWSHDGFTMSVEANVKHGGLASVKCSGRSHTWNGPAQMVQISRGRTYVFRSYIKIINDFPGHDYQTVVVKIAFKMKDGSTNYFPVCERTFISSSDGWTLLGGDFQPPNQEWNSAKLYVEGLLPHTDYYFDDASLTELKDNVNWQQEADASIESLRKGDIHVDVKVSDTAKIDPKDLTVQIRHLKHSFGWGSVVRSDLMTDPDFLQYQQVVYSMFNWATIQDYKWRYNRGNRTHPDYSRAVAATEVLNSHGLNVRGHCMFWAVPGHSPNYVDGLSGSEVRQEVDSHVTYMTGITKGKLQHWDVNNELVHGRYFEQKTGDPRYTEHMFTAVHRADPSPTLFLNDYNVVASGQVTQSYLSQIEKFKAANVGLGAVGVQSHFKDFVEPDPTVLKSRLDFLASAGLPIWITELDLAAHDDSTSADWLERVLRVYFAHPAVNGVIFWGFWDHDMDPKKALVEGYGFRLKPQGQRLMKLIKETWSTHVNTSLATGTSFDVRGFKGDYEAVVWYRGQPIKRQTFSLTGTSKSVNIVVSGSDQAVALPTAVDPFNHINPSHPEVTSNNLHTIGRAQTSTSSTRLQCVSRQSRVSAVGDDKHVEVSCKAGEVMTGCSSRAVNSDWHRDGEQVQVAGGRPRCRAIDGYSSTAGVKAEARCCSVRGLQCSYRVAGPSGTGVDDRVTATCDSHRLALGCAAWSYNSNSDGSVFANTSCAAQNDDPSSGVYSYALCCAAPGMTCTTVTSQPSSRDLGSKVGVSCPQNHVMTGCNVFSQHGRAGGAFIQHGGDGTDTCTAVNGALKTGAEVGVTAMAACCRV